MGIQDKKGNALLVMLGVFQVAALAAADHASLVSGNLCVSRHRLIQDEWCQFNCNSERPNCPADTCTCEGSISFAGSSSIHADIDARSDEQAEQAVPSLGNHARNSSSSVSKNSLPPVNSSKTPSPSSSESPAQGVLRQAGGGKIDSIQLHSQSGRRNAGINGKLVLSGSNDGKLPSLASQIVEKFFNLCKSAHGSDCVLAKGSLLHNSATDVADVDQSSRLHESATDATNAVLQDWFGNADGTIN